MKPNVNGITEDQKAARDFDIDNDLGPVEEVIVINGRTIRRRYFTRQMIEDLEREIPLLNSNSRSGEPVGRIANLLSDPVFRNPIKLFLNKENREIFEFIDADLT